MSTLTDKLPKLPEIKLPEVSAVKIDLDEAKKPAFAAAGVVDLYVEQVKELPATAAKKTTKAAVKTAETTAVAVEDAAEKLG